MSSDDLARLRRETFGFGRFDVRAESVEGFRRGVGFKVLELNGLTSEAAHIYDPKHTLRQAYAVLFEQWRTAFEIARLNRDAGAEPARVRDVLRTVLAYARR